MAVDKGKCAVLRTDFLIWSSFCGTFSNASAKDVL